MIFYLPVCLFNVFPPAGHIVHAGSSSAIADPEYGLTEATQGLTDLDLREQELKDMEVARRLQEEELRVREKKHQC